MAEVIALDEIIKQIRRVDVTTYDPMYCVGS